MFPYQPEPDWYRRRWEDETAAEPYTVLLREIAQYAAARLGQALAHIPHFGSRTIRRLS
jgi:hypothetical protein